MLERFTETERERHARLGRRKHDKVEIEVIAATLVTGALFAFGVFEYCASTNAAETLAFMMIGGVLGLTAGYCLARVLRNGSPWLFAPLIVSVVAFGVGMVLVHPAVTPPVAGPSATAPSSSTTGPSVGVDDNGNEVASDAVVPPGADTSPLTCNIDLTVATPLPAPECGARVRIEAKGKPTSAPSGWDLPPEAKMWLTVPGTDGTLLQVSAADPECVGEDPAVTVRSGVGRQPAAWLEQARTLELVAAPVGTRIVLYTECANNELGTGLQTTTGWIITVA